MNKILTLTVFSLFIMINYLIATTSELAEEEVLLTQRPVYTSSDLGQELTKLKSNAPLTHNITNFVSMDLVANSLLSLGAKPIMAHAPQEIEELARLSTALVLNIGTLSTEWNETMEKTLELYVRQKKPAVLDPVGAGATTLRTETSLKLINQGGIKVVRGNASEIKGLISSEFTTKGVESTLNSLDIIDQAVQFARDKKIVVVASGAIDVITDGNDIYEISNGHELMAKVTGLGCVATALIGAFIGQSPDRPMLAALSAMGVMGICGDRAAMESRAPASFRTSFIDHLYQITSEDIIKSLKLKKTK